MAKVSIDCKKLMVEEISSRIKRKDTLIITNYKGLNAQNLNELRRTLRNISGEYIVIKNSMAKRAMGKEDINSKILEFVDSEVGIAVNTKDEPTDISKILVKFSKDHEGLKIRGGIMNGSLISTDEIKILASLPSREILLGKLANVLNAPIQGLAGALNAIMSKLVYALNAVRDKRSEDRSQNTEVGEQKTEGESEKAQGTEEKQETKEKTEKVEEKKEEDTKGENKT